MILYLLLTVVPVVIAQGRIPWQHRPTPRVIDGQPTTIEKHPYMAHVQNYQFFVCGGSILNTRWVLTAAHCVEEGTYKAYRVRVGTSLKYGRGPIHQASAVIKHAEFSKPTYVNHDIALIKVKDPFKFSNTVQAIGLATNKSPPANTPVVLTGWGSIDYEYDTDTDQLLEVTTYTFSWQDCYERNNLEIPVTPGMLCAGNPKGGGLSSCFGDSGGPITYRGTVVGISSWTVGCGKPGHPSVYTNVAKYRKWIRQNMK